MYLGIPDAVSVGVPCDPSVAAPQTASATRFLVFQHERVWRRGKESAVRAVRIRWNTTKQVWTGCS